MPMMTNVTVLSPRNSKVLKRGYLLCRSMWFGAVAGKRADW